MLMQTDVNAMVRSSVIADSFKRLREKSDLLEDQGDPEHALRKMFMDMVTGSVSSLVSMDLEGGRSIFNSGVVGLLTSQYNHLAMYGPEYKQNGISLLMPGWYEVATMFNAVCMGWFYHASSVYSLNSALHAAVTFTLDIQFDVNCGIYYAANRKIIIARKYWDALK